MRPNYPFMHSDHIYSLTPLTDLIRGLLKRFRQASEPLQTEPQPTPEAFRERDHWLAYHQAMMGDDRE